MKKTAGRSRRNPEPYGRGAAESQHQIPEDLRRDGNHDECTREEPQNFEETFAGIEKMREEMKRSASEVETFMKDPVKSIFPGEAKETAAEPDREDTAEEAEEEDEIVENSAVIDLENEPDYLDDDNDEEEDEIPNRAHDEEDEEE